MSFLTEDRADQLLLMPPHVYVRTLGGFGVSVDAQPVSCTMRGIGAPQMQLPLGYLITRRDQSSCRDVLLEIARRRSDHAPRHVLSALVRLLHSWDMAPALVRDAASLTLKRHSIWGTDTDALQRLWHLANGLQSGGEQIQALAALQEAAQLCGGVYMPFYDSLPEYAITGEVDRWQDVQKNVLLALAEMYLALVLPYPCAEAQHAAGRAVVIDHWNPTTCLAAANIARRCGNEVRARFYEERARSHDDQPSRN